MNDKETWLIQECSTATSGPTDNDNTLPVGNTGINAAAVKVGELYKQEKAVCTPCVVSHLPVMSGKDLGAADTLSTPPDSSKTTNGRKSSQYNDWLQRGGASAIPKKATSQEDMVNLFIRPSTEVELRKEKDRQQRLHYLLKRVWKDIYRADLKDPKVIVNWCCGIGLWDMEMAALFPEAKIIGVDYKETTLTNSLHEIHNLEFRHAVIQSTYTGLESFQEDSVDFVILRDTWLMNAPVWKWDNLLKAIFRILKPGGWIEIEEHSLVIESNGPCGKKLYDWFDVFFNEIQVDRNIAKKLGDHLLRAGFIEIDKQAVDIPLGEWCLTDYSRETGYLFKDLIERRIRILGKWLCKFNNVEMKEMNQTFATVMDQEVDEYHSCVDWLSYTARKPHLLPSYQS